MQLKLTDHNRLVRTLVASKGHILISLCAKIAFIHVGLNPHQVAHNGVR